MSDAAARYEKQFPGTGLPEAQKQERQERISFKQERANHGRTGRTRGVVFDHPSLPDRVSERLAARPPRPKDMF